MELTGRVLFPAVGRLGLAGLVAAAALAFAAPSANAGVSPFCPPVWNSQQYVNAYSFCVGGKFYTLSDVEYVTANGSGVYHCAGAKQYSDGSGANIIPFTCNSAQYATSICVTDRVGYPKGINDSASPHYFWGRAYWGGSCAV